MKCEYTQCMECGDTIVHHNDATARVSNSAWGQHVADNYAVDFWFTDIDGVHYKRATRIMRVVERKHWDDVNEDTLRDSQREVLPVFALGIATLVARGELHPDSGVFRLQAEPPFARALVSRIYADKKEGAPVMLAGEALHAFVQCRSHHAIP